MSGVTDTCCGSACWHDSEQAELGRCWEKLSAVDEEIFGDDWSWVHACEGHAKMYPTSDRAKYRNEPPPPHQVPLTPE